jgi:hypothetical protein
VARPRAEIEYPQRPGDDIDLAEAIDAITMAAHILDVVKRLLPQLDLYQ